MDEIDARLVGGLVVLAAVADDYEQALRDADRLRQDLGKMEAVLNEHREHERNLRNTLLNLTILILAMASVLLLPHAGVALETLSNFNAQWAVQCAGVLLFLIVVFIGVNMAPKIFNPPDNAPFACFTEP